MVIQVLHCPYCQEIDIVKHRLHLKASNAIGAVPAVRGVDGPFSSTIPTLANHLR